MKLRTKYIAFVVILHFVALVLSYFVFTNDKLIFIGSELLMLVSLYISIQLYRELIQPLKTLMQGVEAIKDRDFTVKFLTTGKHEMDELINVYNQMIDQLRDERTRQEQQHFFLEKLIQTSPTGIIILDHDEKVQQVNPKAAQLLNIEQRTLIGKLMSEIHLPVIIELRQLKSGEAKTISLNGINTYKLQKSHFIDRGFPRHFIMIEKLTAEILAAEKKAYGKVIRMMAHEVNNTIGPVNSILQSTLKTANLWEEEKNERLKQALQVAVDRNQNLNLFMRNFADVVRLPEPVKKKVDLHQLLQNVTTLMELKAGEKDIKFEYHLAKEPIFIVADAQQIEQTLINIVKNAIEAIDEKGTIRFATSLHPKQLIITDSGTGIQYEDASQLFSPFFSTKKDGQGVGLTLVKEILLNHGFEFSLKTVEPGETRFSLQMR